MNYYNPYNYYRQQGMPGMNVNLTDAQEMGQQMPTMPMQPMMPMQQMPIMQPIMPMQPMMPVGEMIAPIGVTPGTMPTNIASIPPITQGPLGQDPVMDTDYTQGYLKTQIGKRVKVEFLIGTDMFVDREGTLVDVGISYIIINEVETDDLLLCDIYSIKFVRFYF